MFNTLLLFILLVGRVHGRGNVLCNREKGTPMHSVNKISSCRGNICVIATSYDYVVSDCAPLCSPAVKKSMEHLLDYQLREAGVRPSEFNVSKVISCCDINFCNFHDPSEHEDRENKIQCYSYDGLKSEMNEKAEKCSGHSCMSLTAKGYIKTRCSSCHDLTRDLRRKTVAFFEKYHEVTIAQHNVAIHCCTGDLCNGAHKYENGGIDGNDGKGIDDGNGGISGNGGNHGNGGNDVVVPLKKPTKKGLECYSFGGLKSQMLGKATKCSSKNSCITVTAGDYMATDCVDCYEISPEERKRAVEGFKENYGVTVREDDVEIECCSSNLCNAVYEKEIILECYSYSGLKSEIMKKAKKCSSSSCMSVTAQDYIFSSCGECFGPTEEVRENTVARLKEEFDVTIKEEDVDASCCIENLCNGVSKDENGVIVKGVNSLFSPLSLSLSFWSVLIYSNP